MRFEAEVRQVKTLVDRSINVTLNLPEYQLTEAMALMAMVNDMVLVSVDCSVIAGQIHDDRRKDTKHPS